MTTNISSAVPEFPSRRETSPTESAGNVAAASSLVRVPVAEPSAMVAPLAPESVSERVSFASITVSPLTITCTIFEVSPAAKVSFPVSAA